MTALELVPSRCAICGTTGQTREVYPATFDRGALDPVLFSARRSPDGVHFRMARCETCGLLRSDPVATPGALAALYAESTFDEAEVPNLRRTYGRYLARLDRHGAGRVSLLEIGSGSGFFLTESLAHGYSLAVGVEPSVSAGRLAAPDPRIKVVSDVMRPGLFAPGSFDVICVFQTLDHLPDPATVLDACRLALRPGGLLLALNHDLGAWSARLLGERSPIIDIEHTFLYDRRTMRRLVADRGFDVLEVGSALNRVSLRYLAHLAALPGGPGAAIRRALARNRLGNLSLWVPLGNLYLIARRPRSSGV
jgi:SAM-dependent methyltransferase